MSTDLLFREDACLTQCDARITAIGEQGIELDRTVFYPHGGCESVVSASHETFDTT